MKLLTLTSIALPLSFLTPQAAAFFCFGDGQPFNEDWKPLRVVHACEKAKGEYDANESFSVCAPMGDDKVIFTFKNHLARKSTLEKDVCVNRVNQVIDHCGGHTDDNHGGFHKFEAFRIGFDPQESGNGCG